MEAQKLNEEVSVLKRTREYINDMWWVLILTGVASILFGIATLFMPGLTLGIMIAFFAAFVVVVGIVEIILGLSEVKKNSNWWLSLIIGLLLLGLGAYLITNPGITAATFVLILGWALLARGIFDIVMGLTVHTSTEMKIFRVVAGALGVIAGIVIWIYPVTGTLAFTWVLGLYAVIAGCLMFGEALATRSLLSDVDNMIERE